ncbi:VOC family protein [Novosphingobium colocasiae]|uniref:VOC family protein n=1 Tax=Novosphingobium colocasiae TaxID=1256513 RepID=UPI0035AE1D82
MEKPVVRLGYAGFRGDRAEWQRFACDIFGLQAVPAHDDNELRLRADERAWRLAVRETGDPGLDYLGFEVANHEDLDGIMARLHAHGFAAQEDPSLARRRDVQRLVVTTAPDGTPLEFFIGGLIVSRPFASPTGARFVTGEAGLGHVLLIVPDAAEALRYFTQVIGLRRSDSIEVAPGCDGHFLNGGLRHHIVAVAEIPGLTGFDHIYLEVEDLVHVGQAWDKVSGGAAPVARSIGQHANDPAISFYTGSPSGFLFEYGCHSRLIPDVNTWVETRWESAYLWGGTYGTHAVG